MWNPLGKIYPTKNGLSHLHPNPRVHVEHPTATIIFQNNLELYLSELYEPEQPFIILCIGTDRSTGDSLGPLTGAKLQALRPENARIYGTLDEPVHAVNLQETISTIFTDYDQPFILAIDACLGRSESVGYLSIKEGPLQPGTGVNKDLPAVGNLQIIGIVNVGGFMEYMVLQNTRLNLVMKMADIISQSVYNCVQNLKNAGPVPVGYAAPLEPVP